MAELTADVFRPVGRAQGRGGRAVGGIAVIGPSDKTQVFYEFPAIVPTPGGTVSISPFKPAQVWQGSAVATAAANITQIDRTAAYWYTFTLDTAGGFYLCKEADWAAIAVAHDAIRLEYIQRGWARRAQPRFRPAGGQRVVWLCTGLGILRMHADGTNEGVFSGAACAVYVPGTPSGDQVWAARSDDYGGPGITRYQLDGTCVVPRVSLPRSDVAACFVTGGAQDEVWVVPYNGSDFARFATDGTLIGVVAGLPLVTAGNVAQVGSQVWIAQFTFGVPGVIVRRNLDGTSAGATLTATPGALGLCTVPATPPSVWVVSAHGGGAGIDRYLFDGSPDPAGDLILPGGPSLNAVGVVGNEVWAMAQAGGAVGAIYRLDFSGNVLGSYVNAALIRPGTLCYPPSFTTPIMGGSFLLATAAPAGSDDPTKSSASLGYATSQPFSTYVPPQPGAIFGSLTSADRHDLQTVTVAPYTPAGGTQTDGTVISGLAGVINPDDSFTLSCTTSVDIGIAGNYAVAFYELSPSVNELNDLFSGTTFTNTIAGSLYAGGQIYGASLGAGGVPPSGVLTNHIVLVASPAPAFPVDWVYRCLFPSVGTAIPPNAHLELAANDTVTGVWINGTRVYTGPSATLYSGGAWSPLTISIPHTLLNPGANALVVAGTLSGGATDTDHLLVAYQFQFV